MNKTGFMYLLSLAALFILAGCAKEAQVQVPPSEPVCLVSVEKGVIMDAAEDVLRKMHFAIEKNDLSSGTIRTRPLRGSQFFEFWRKDSAGPLAAAEANIHSIRRTAILDISEADSSICAKCDVQVQRLSVPQKQLRGFSEASGLYTEGDNRLQKLKLEAEDVTWIELGPDPGLEAKILELIKTKITKSKAGR